MFRAPGVLEAKYSRTGCNAYRSGCNDRGFGDWYHIKTRVQSGALLIIDRDESGAFVMLVSCFEYIQVHTCSELIDEPQIRRVHQSYVVYSPPQHRKTVETDTKRKATIGTTRFLARFLESFEFLGRPCPLVPFFFFAGPAAPGLAVGL
jgi:hypothetical protein